jgi:hypothetical protein
MSIKNVIIEEVTVICSHCEIGYPVHNSTEVDPLIFIKNSLIRAYSIFMKTQLWVGILFGSISSIKKDYSAGVSVSV